MTLCMTHATKQTYAALRATPEMGSYHAPRPGGNVLKATKVECDRWVWCLWYASGTVSAPKDGSALQLAMEITQ